MASFSLFRHQMGSGEHRLTNAGGIALLKRKLKDIKELDATCAVFYASNSVDLDALIYAINGLIAHHSEEIERRKTQKKAAAAKVAAAAAAGGKSQGGKGKHKRKKGSDKPCEHCHKPGHTAQTCWLNPKSSAYRPDFAAKINGSSASSSNGGRSAPPGLGAASIGARTGPAVPTDVLTKAFSEFLTKRFGGSAWLADIGPNALQQFAGAAWALDSGATQFCIMGENADDAMWETVQSADCDLDTGAGTARPTAMVDAMVGPLLSLFRAACHSKLAVRGRVRVGPLCSAPLARASEREDGPEPEHRGRDPRLDEAIAIVLAAIRAVAEAAARAPARAPAIGKAAAAGDEPWRLTRPSAGSQPEPCQTVAGFQCADLFLRGRQKRDLGSRVQEGCGSGRDANVECRVLGRACASEASHPGPPDETAQVGRQRERAWRALQAVVTGEEPPGPDGNTGVRHAHRLAPRLAPRAWPRRNKCMAKSGGANHPRARHTVQLLRAAFASCRGATGGRSSPSVGVVWFRASRAALGNRPRMPLQELEEAVAQQARAGASATERQRHSVGSAQRRRRRASPFRSPLPHSLPRTPICQQARKRLSLCAMRGGGGRGDGAWGRGLPAACWRDRRRWSGWARRGCLDCRSRRPRGADAKTGKTRSGGRGRGRRSITPRPLRLRRRSPPRKS